MEHGDQSGYLLQPLGTIEVGNLRGRLVADPIGRKCLELSINNKEVLFTISQMLLIKQMFEVALQQLSTYTPVTKDGD